MPISSSRIDEILNTNYGDANSPTVAVKSVQTNITPQRLDEIIATDFTPPKPIAQPISQPKQTNVQKIGSTLSTLGSKVKQGVQEFGKEVMQEGIGGAIANRLIPKEKQQPEDVIQQNLRTYVEAPKAEEIISKVIVDAAESKTRDVAAAGAAMGGLTVPKSLTASDKKLLSEKDYLDEKGEIKKGKTVVETAKNAADLYMVTSLFFPEAFVASAVAEAASGTAKTINVAGKAVPVAKVASGIITGGTYNTLYTPNLEKIFTDPQVAGDAAKHFLVGAGIGAAVEIPVSLIRAPKAVMSLSAVEQTEAKELYLALAKKYHPDSLINGNEEAFKAVAKQYEGGNLSWLRKLNNAGPAEAEQILKTKLPNTEKFGGFLGEKPISEATPQSKTPTSTTTPKVPESTTTGSRKLVKVEGLPDTVIGRSAVINPDGTASFNLEIAENARGQGIGASAVKSIEAAVSKEGATVIKIPVKEESAGFFKKQGYKETGPVKGGLIPMEKILSSTPKTTTPKPVEEKPKLQEVSVPRNQLPVGAGAENVSTLEARVRNSLDKVTPEQIDSLGLTKYNQMNNKDTIKAASEYVLKNPDDALKVLQGDLEAPKGLPHNSIYVAMVNNSAGNIELATKLATLRSTRFGQEIEILKELNPDSPVKAISDVIKVKEAAIEKRTGKKASAAIKDTAKEIKKKIVKPTKQDWTSFIESIEC